MSKTSSGKALANAERKRILVNIMYVLSRSGSKSLPRLAEDLATILIKTAKEAK